MKMALKWKAAIAGSTVLGAGLAGFVAIGPVAADGGDIPDPRGFTLQQSASVRSPLSAPIKIKQKGASWDPMAAGATSVDSAVSVATASGFDSPASPASAESPDASVNSPASPNTPVRQDSPASPNTPVQQDSPASPVQQASPASPATPPSPDAESVSAGS
jgi:hypothetical protein